jgi:hypothetical protein
MRGTQSLSKAAVMLGCVGFIVGCSGTATEVPAAGGPVSASAPTTAAAAVQASTPPAASPSSATPGAAGDKPRVRYFKPDEIAIPAGLSDEELVAAFIERSTAWNMAATSPEVYDAIMQEHSVTDLLVESRRAHGDYVTGLIHGTNAWEAVGNVDSSFLEQRLERVDQVAQKYFASVEQAKAQPDVYEPYMEWFELLEISSASGTKGGTRYFTIEYVAKSNDEKTEPSFGNPDSTPPYPVRAQITFDESSGHALIKDINVGRA